MPLLWKYFNKTYHLAHGDIRIYFRYNAEFLGNFEFDLDCISIGEIESGYEDDDQLTFYPNILKLAFADVNRYNYEYLKQILDSYPDLTNWETTVFELYYNKKGGIPKRMFLGSVDKKTLRYSEKERILEFEVVDISQILKNLTIDNLTGGANSLPYYIHSAYKNIFPDLNYNLTTDINTFKGASFSGIYWKHNWKFESYSTHVIKDFITGYEDINFYQIWDNPLFKKNNYAELLKALAKQFGMVIGCEEPNKIYAYKRFVTPAFAEAQAIDVLPYLLDDFTKEVWLPNILAVRNTYPTYNSGEKKVIAGDFRPNSHDSSKPDNLDSVLEISTDLTTNVAYSSWLYMKVLTGTGYEVIQYVTEPDLNNYRETIENVIANLYFFARQRSKDKYEFTLYDINYSMADYYKIKQDGYSQKILRPFVIKKDLVKNTTKMTALEIGLNL